jgi:hypothetical protein
MIEKRSWEEFRLAGLLWWVNHLLHLFGWALVLEMNDDETIRDVYPAHCHFRGFETKNNDLGFWRLTKHMHANADRVLKDVTPPKDQDD